MTHEDVVQSDRGTGRSTRQMKAAKRDAVFVIRHTSSKRYYTDLAKHIGRTDLRIKSIAEFVDRAWAYGGCRFTDIVLDHAVKLTDKQREYLAQLQTRIIT